MIPIPTSENVSLLGIIPFFMSVILAITAPITASETKTISNIRLVFKKAGNK